MSGPAPDFHLIWLVGFSTDDPEPPGKPCLCDDCMDRLMADDEA